jgi:hypoxanthine-guanine phosphoribosyltransferase
MTSTTASQIVKYISQNGRASGKELTDFLGTISDRAVRKQLKSLVDKNTLQKIGHPPKVYYSLTQAPPVTQTVLIKPAILKTINDRYLYISPTGDSISGWPGFITWCQRTNQNPQKTAKEYIATLRKYDRYKVVGLIDGLPKIISTFSYVWLDKVYYLDFYSIERFGKTKLGQMLLYAKQSQNIALIRQLIHEVRPRIQALVTRYNIDGVLFIPPTVKRDIQFMKVLQEHLKLPVRILAVAKVKTEITVPQKSLSKLEDRIENASRTIIVEDLKKYRNILLIDDAVGSGATLNETAKQIKHRKLTRGHIIGLAITGSFKGFDVISEV